MTRICFAIVLAAAQMPTAGIARAANQTKKEVRFEVLSIRPMSGALTGMNTNPASNGFESSLTLYQAIMIAYGPVSPLEWRSVEVLNAPAWTSEFYDFKARVSRADLTAWQNQSKDHELLRSAMRMALSERCKLAIHEQATKGQIFELLVNKGGPHLKPPTPDSALPVGFKFPSGGIALGKTASGKIVRDWYAASMEDLRAFLSSVAQPVPVRDRTGLTGRYDFTLTSTALRAADFPPDENHVYAWPVGHLGLQLRPGSENRPSLVVDHIERPTPN